jgi:TIR domain
MAGIFVSYRRDDSRDIAGRLFDRLRQDYAAEQLFLDIDGIPAGTNFETVLAGRLEACDVLLAVIGPEWLNAADASGKRRLDEPGDYVRREIAAALQRNDVRVIPLLVSGAQMPRAESLPDDLKPLVSRQNYQLRYERFNADANDLIAQLAKVVRPAGWRRFGNRAIALAAAAVLVAGGIYALTTSHFNFTGEGNDPVLREQALQLCKEASEVTARLASSSNRETWSHARERFWELYNGPLYIIETKEKEKSPDHTSPLEAAMVRFGRLLKEVGDPPEKLPLTTLDQGSLAVARACKDTVERM